MSIASMQKQTLMEKLKFKICQTIAGIAGARYQYEHDCTEQSGSPQYFLVLELNASWRSTFWDYLSRYRFRNSPMLEPSGPRIQRALRKLQDQQNGTQDECNIKHYFKSTAPFLFRAYQQSIVRFELIFHKRLMVDAIHYADGVPSNLLLRKPIITKMMDNYAIRAVASFVPRSGTSRSIFGTIHAPSRATLMRSY